MDHDDGDWDSEVGSGLLDVLILDSDGNFSWLKFVIVCIALTLLAYHYWG